MEERNNPQMFSAVLKKIECIEGQLGIFIDSLKQNHFQGSKELLWMELFSEIMVWFRKQLKNFGEIL